MTKRLPLMIVFAVLLSLVLVACGDEAAPVPTYTGATSLATPDSFKSQMTTSMKDVKNASVESFKTSDDLTKVKSGFESSFKGAGWSDQTAKYSSGSDLKPLTDAGVFFVGYQKGNKAAVIMGIPGPIAKAMGYTGVSDTENAYLVISGNE
ncbi:MAG: hypothetical protein JWP00_1827 [Chloroflexi bacterium]|jgi:Flp pilus assembly protein TadD|nr:hypothetical protein [Chloroflexota bacterium]